MDRTIVNMFQEQLAHGIRFFDLRFRPVGSSFAIHHGAIYLNKMAGEAFSEFRTFLSNNPSETVIISYQRANTASGIVYKLHFTLLLFCNPIHQEWVNHQLKISYCWTWALWTAKISPQKKFYMITRLNMLFSPKLPAKTIQWC